MLSQSIYVKAELQKLGYKKQISFSLFRTSTTRKKSESFMATFELYRRSTIGMCLTETLDEMVSSGILGPELAIQVLVQFDKGHLHTYRFCENVWTFILQDALFKGICTRTDSATTCGHSFFKYMNFRKMLV
ncbi:putative transcription initiation factor IIA, gamma subunit, transcription factor IIA, beta-barrel [Helianthus debilis subsp. tardiflorus]